MDGVAKSFSAEIGKRRTKTVKPERSVKLQDARESRDWKMEDVQQPNWQEWQGSNLRPPVLETGALPIELHPYWALL